MQLLSKVLLEQLSLRVLYKQLDPILFIYGKETESSVASLKNNV